LDIRGGFDEGAECVDYFEQCCDVGSVLTSTPKPIYVAPPPQPQPQGQGAGGPLPPPKGPTQPTNSGNGGTGGVSVPSSEAKRGCGFRNSEGVGFRITGNSQGESEYGEFVDIFKSQMIITNNL
jgi:hypothetical protein